MQYIHRIIKVFQQALHLPSVGIGFKEMWLSLKQDLQQAQRIGFSHMAPVVPIAVVRAIPAHIVKKMIGESVCCEQILHAYQSDVH